MLALAIMGLLMDTPLHGYEIRKQLSILLGFSGAISYGSLYPTLAKLHRQGLIATEIGDAPRTPTQPIREIFSTGSLSGDLAFSSQREVRPRLMNRKTKKVYVITDKGREMFAEKLRTSYVKHADDDRAFVVHLAFMGHSSASDISTFLTERQSSLKTRLQAIPSLDHHALKLWNDVEREYIENQISFLESLRQEHDSANA
jgi:DNA-binding PadR family transcriptional regulator